MIRKEQLLCEALSAAEEALRLADEELTRLEPLYEEARNKYEAAYDSRKEARLALLAEIKLPVAMRRVPVNELGHELEERPS